MTVPTPLTRSPLDGLKLGPVCIGGLVCLVWIGGLSCSSKEASAPVQVAGEARRSQPTRVRTVALERREMIRTLQTTTVCESEKEVEVLPRLGGVVVELLVEEGDAVEEGAILAVLDQREVAMALNDARIAVQEAQDEVEKSALAKLEAEARLESSKLTWEQKTRDHERNEKAGLISERDLDASQLEKDTAYGTHLANRLALERTVFEARASRTAVQRAELAFERAQLNHSFTQITAPFTGVIADRKIRVGDTANPGEPAFVLTDSTNLRAVFYRPQRELPLFANAAGKTVQTHGASNGASNGSHSSAGIEITARAEALPGRVFQGRIDRISPSIDPTNGAFRVTASLVQPEESDGPQGSTAQGLLPGMLVRLEIVTDRHPGALVVPKRALHREGDERLIYMVEDGRARRVSVREGFSDEDNIEVVPLEADSLTPGDRIVVVGSTQDLENDSEVFDESLAAERAEDAAGAAGAESEDTATVTESDTTDDSATPEPSTEGANGG
jgi:membrane fusion protein (multidrug efflux system)